MHKATFFILYSTATHLINRLNSHFDKKNGVFHHCNDLIQRQSLHFILKNEFDNFHGWHFMHTVFKQALTECDAFLNAGSTSVQVTA